jgi:hypothetical protein
MQYKLAAYRMLCTGLARFVDALTAVDTDTESETLNDAESVTVWFASPAREDQPRLWEPLTTSPKSIDENICNRE